jgi:hypothetical protein
MLSVRGIAVPTKHKSKGGSAEKETHNVNEGDV